MVRKPFLVIALWACAVPAMSCVTPMTSVPTDAQVERAHAYLQSLKECEPLNPANPPPGFPSSKRPVPRWKQYTKSQLKAITFLDAGCSSFSDAGLAIFSNFETIEAMYLVRTKISDDGLRVVSKMRNLESLVLHTTFVSDVGVGHLRDLPRLQSLGLDHTRLTNRSVEYFLSMKALKRVRVSRTGITEQAIRDARQVRRDLAIEKDY